MKPFIFQSIRITLVFLVLFSGIYTILVLGFAQLSRHKGNGETIMNNGKKYYSNIGQTFTNDAYFWSRPSAVAYNAAGSAGSNKGPTNPDYLKQVKARIDTFLAHNPTAKASEIPSELVTASGSGLDPHISVDAANIQVKRIAKIRGIAAGNLQQLIMNNTEKPLFGFLGTETVHVLKLNLALDHLK